MLNIDNISLYAIPIGTIQRLSLDIILLSHCAFGGFQKALRPKNVVDDKPGIAENIFNGIYYQDDEKGTYGYKGM